MWIHIENSPRTAAVRPLWRLHKVPGSHFLRQLLLTGTVGCRCELPPGVETIFSDTRANFDWGPSQFFSCFMQCIGSLVLSSNTELWQKSSKVYRLVSCFFGIHCQMKKLCTEADVTSLLGAIIFWMTSKQLTTADMLWLVRGQQILGCSQCVRLPDDEQYKRPRDNAGS